MVETFETPTPEEIKKLRLAAQLTQTEFGERTDSSLSHIQNLEGGTYVMARGHWFIARMLFDDSYLIKWLRQQIERRPALRDALRIRIGT